MAEPITRRNDREEPSTLAFVVQWGLVGLFGGLGLLFLLSGLAGGDVVSVLAGGACLVVAALGVRGV